MLCRRRPRVMGQHTRIYCSVVARSVQAAKKDKNCRHLGPRRRMEPGTCFIQQQTQVWLGKIVKSRCVSLWRGIVNCGTRDDDSSANKRFHEVCGASAAMCARGNPWTLLRWRRWPWPTYRPDPAEFPFQVVFCCSSSSTTKRHR